MSEISVRTTGARGDGAHDDGAAIQAALDAPSPCVVVPPGRYRVGCSLRIGSGKTLRADPDARIEWADGAGRGPSDFLLSNANPAGGDRDIVVEGGVWNGNARGNPRGPDRPGSFTGGMMDFRNVRGLALRRLTLADAPSYHVRLAAVRGFTVETIRFERSTPAPNQDGLHVAGFCEDGAIRDIVASGEGCTGDDLVALLADDALHRAQNLGLLCGPVRRIRIERLRADDCHSFVRLASVWHPIEDVEVRDVEGGCRICAINADALRWCLVPVFRREDPRYAGGVGALRDIRAAGFRVFKSGPDPAPLLRLETRMERFALEDFQRDRARDAAPGAPTLAVAHVACAGARLEDAPAVFDAGNRLACHADRIGRFAVARSRMDPIPPPGPGRAGAG